VKRVALIEFPGSHDVPPTEAAIRQLAPGVEAYRVWHDDLELRKADVVVLAGGYSYADYLRPGALGLASNIAGPIRKFAQDGGPVLGIGNGFQFLCELDVLPGALLENPKQEFINALTWVTVENPKGTFLSSCDEFQVLNLPVANYYSRYWADRRTMRELEEEGQIALRYCDKYGDIDYDTYFNGSLGAIAGVFNRKGNVLGLMPHPELALDELQGSEDGRLFFSALAA